MLSADLLSSRGTTHAGTAGLIFDLSDVREVSVLSSSLTRLLSAETMRLDVIVVGVYYSLLHKVVKVHKAGNVIARPSVRHAPFA